MLNSYRRRRAEKKEFRKFLEEKSIYDQFVEYLKFGTNLPMLHLVKQNNIDSYRKEYGFNTLIETGTFLGDMVQAQLKHFEQIVSIELGKELHRDAVKRFEQYPHVRILQGDSGLVLKELIKEINAPALFWLDGHYSAGITAKGDKDTPVLDELRTILSSPYEHGILIDDARLFIGQKDYPTIDELSAFVMQIAPDRMVAVADDIIRIFKRKIL